MGKTLSRRGDFAKAIGFFEQAVKRTSEVEQKTEVFREIGTAHYRNGNYVDASKFFYEALQWKRNPIDQWMLKVSMDQLPTAMRPPMPEDVLFPRAPEAANPKLAFRDIAPELGVNRFDGNGTCSWADFDNDGDQDLFLAGSGTFMAVYRNEGRGRKFTDVTAEVGLAKVPSGYSLNLIDYDNDGWLDLYVTLNGWSGPMANRLYRNNKGRFEDVTAKSGAGDAGDGFVSVWGDLDNDGFLDLVIANGVLKDGSTPQIYRNKGDGTFVRATPFQEPAQWGAIGVALGDYDKDGDLDILINGLNDAPNRLYRNDGSWKFTEVSRAAGIAQAPHNGFVCFFFDYDNDGWPDILTTSLAPWPVVVDGMREGYRPKSVHPDASRLFRNNGNGTFTDVTLKAGLHYPMGTMGAGIADLDNDGYLDIYFGTGDPQLTRLEPNRFFRNKGDGTFEDQTRAAGFARPGNKGHGVTFIDIDNDGDLDVYAQLGGHYPGDHAFNAFYENRGSTGNHWLELELTGTRSNRFAVGAQVTVRSGEWRAYREIKGSEGFGATNPYRVHIGLGARTKIDQVVIRWPSGVVQTLANAEVDRVLAVKEEVNAAAYAQAGDYRSAEPLYRASCQAKDPDACYFWARTLYALDRHEEALSALSAQARSWRVWMATAQSQEALGRAAEAEAAYAEAIALRASDKAPRSVLEPEAAFGLFLYRQGRMEEAAATLAKAGPAGAFQHARALFQLGRLDESLAILQPLFAASREAHELASRIYYRQGKTELGDRHAAQGSATSK
jgi:tetratricopeptide (TPR) repeat protein